MMAHHRRNGGILYACITPNKKYILTLGRNKNLVCNCLEYIEVDHEKEDGLEREALQKMEWMFTRKTIGFEEKGKLKMFAKIQATEFLVAPTDTTWLELIALRNKEKQRKSCIKERYYILEEFKVIQQEVQDLLTKNLEGPENEVLDVQKFNLDSEYSEEQRLWSATRCKHAKIYLETLIVAQDNVTKWCKNFFWDRMDVQGKAIRAISDNFYLRNYVMLPHDQNNDIIKAIEEKRRVEDLMARQDSFQPWIPYTDR